MKHLSLTERADLLIVAPCTANTLAKLAIGLADNMLYACAHRAMSCTDLSGHGWGNVGTSQRCNLTSRPYKGVGP